MMKRKILGSKVAVILVLAVSGIAVLGAAKPGADDAKSSPTEVRVDNFTFGPDTLTVSVNTTVTWVNKDDIPHVIASTDGVFKSKALDTDDKYSYTFTKAGTYAYFCSLHPKMVGKIIVK